MDRALLIVLVMWVLSDIRNPNPGANRLVQVIIAAFLGCVLAVT